MKFTKGINKVIMKFTIEINKMNHETNNKNYWNQSWACRDKSIDI